MPSHLASSTRCGFESHCERFFLWKRLGVLPKVLVSLVPKVLKTKRVGQRTPVYGTDAPKIPPFRGGESVIRTTL